MVSDWDGWKMHMQGLREVVLIRGGSERAFTGRHFMTLVAFRQSSEVHSSSSIHLQGHIIDIVRVFSRRRYATFSTTILPLPST